MSLFFITRSVTNCGSDCCKTIIYEYNAFTVLNSIGHLAGSSNGRTAVFGTVNRGSIPCPAATIIQEAPAWVSFDYYRLFCDGNRKKGPVYKSRGIETTCRTRRGRERGRNRPKLVTDSLPNSSRIKIFTTTSPIQKETGRPSCGRPG